MIGIFLLSTFVSGYTLLMCRLIGGLRKLYDQPKPIWPGDRVWPRTAIVISLRGSDPFLERCLTNLLNQDYDDFRLYVIIDSESDPAWTAIRNIQATFGADCMQVSILRDPLPTCSLKNSAVIQAIRGLPTDVDIVAFADADAVTPRSWLKDLVTPFANPEIGCSTGIRWYAPTQPTFASVVRCCWNHFATAILYQTSTPWGGSMAIRRTILDSGLTEEWSRMLCEDVHTCRHLKRRGMKLVFVPGATMLNEEGIALGAFSQFARRQNLLFSLYHREWNYVMTLITFGVTMAGFHISLVVSAFIHQQWLSVLVLVAIRQISMWILWKQSDRVEAAIRKYASDRTFPEAPRPTVLTTTIAEIISAYSAFAVYGATSMKWRGIRYQIRGPEKVTLLSYHPYLDDPTAKLAERSSIV